MTENPPISADYNVLAPFDTFITGTGKEMSTDYFVYSINPPFAYVRIIGKTMVECVTIFSNPEETAKLSYGGKDLEGYTKLLSVSDEGSAIKIQLSR